jgi:two-component system, NtrC family, sensor kinase
MRSIYFRLTVLYVLIVTSVLTISGGYSHFFLKVDLEKRHGELRLGLIGRLQTNVMIALRDGDVRQLDNVLMSEMLFADVQGIFVFNEAGDLVAGKVRDRDGRLVPATSGNLPEAEAEETSLVAARSNGETPMPAGRAVAYFSRDNLERALYKDLIHKATEILLLDLLLVLALSLGLRMVFAPLRQLKEGLQSLARDDTGDVQELPEGRQNEIGELVQAFNSILRRLKVIIHNTRKAEECALRASAETARAYEELRLAQDSLLQAERLASLGGLVAGVAHEINTPVGVALTSASVLHDATCLIRQRMDDGAIKRSDLSTYLVTAEESARLIMSNADRAAHLIQSFKQIAVDQTNEERRSFALHAYLDEVVTSLMPRIRKSRVKVVIDCGEDIRINSYPGALAQIITNLTMNSLMHAFDANAAGFIRIQVRQSEDDIELIFSDDGKGIQLEHIGKVFDPFFTTQRGHGGTGLGLNIVFNIIAKQFGGTITVSSKPGEGSRFAICFPATAPQEEYA